MTLIPTKLCTQCENGLGFFVTRETSERGLAANVSSGYGSRRQGTAYLNFALKMLRLHFVTTVN